MATTSEGGSACRREPGPTRLCMSTTYSITAQDKPDMKNFMSARGSSTSPTEQMPCDHIVSNVNDDNIDEGQCHHFSIREYVLQMQMRRANFRSLPEMLEGQQPQDHDNSLLLRTKKFRRWNCRSCKDKLETSYYRTPASALTGFTQIPKHADGKELSQEKGSVKCRSPSSDKKESTEVDPVINDLHDSTPTNPDGTTNLLSIADSVDDMNPPDTCQKIADKEEINNKEDRRRKSKPKKMRLLSEIMNDNEAGTFQKDFENDHIKDSQLSKEDNSMTMWPLEKDGTYVSLHNIGKAELKTYKRRRTSKAHRVVNDGSSLMDSEEKSEKSRTGNCKEKHTTSIMQHNAPHASFDGDENIQNNGVNQSPCSFENELESSKKMCLSKVSSGKRCINIITSNNELTQRKTTEDEEDDCIIISVKEVSTRPQSGKSQNPKYAQLEQQKRQHLHNATATSTISPILSCHTDHHVTGPPPQFCGQMEANKLLSDSSKTATRDPLIQSCSSQFMPSVQRIDWTSSQVLPSSSNYMTEEPEVMKHDPSNQSAADHFQGSSSPSALLTMEARNLFDPRISGPSAGWYRKELMQATHLHGPIDSWKHAGFPHCEAPNRNLTELPQNPKLHYSHNQYSGATYTSYRARSNINENFPQTMELFPQYPHPQNFSKPFRPVPRIGVLSPMLQEEVTRCSENCGTQSGYRLGMPEATITFQMENLASLNSQKFPMNCNSQHLGSVTSIAIPEFLSEGQFSTMFDQKQKQNG